MSIEFTQIEKRTGDDLFSAPIGEGKWSNVVITLLSGKDVFIPGMSRSQLETLRGLIRYRKYGMLKSRSMEVDGVEGRLMRIVRGGRS